jgi:U3 small nucleolar RNA-associated protein 14
MLICLQGSWAGPGAKKAPPKRQFIKKISGVDPTKRADYGKTHVIISEKKDKKASKYLAKDLPYPYTSKAQFEKSLQVPLGTEWNTRVSFQKGTLPKVVKKVSLRLRVHPRSAADVFISQMGVPINPLEKLF